MTNNATNPKQRTVQGVVSSPPGTDTGVIIGSGGPVKEERGQRPVVDAPVASTSAPRPKPQQMKSD
jgi:hypothetical protein